MDRAPTPWPVEPAPLRRLRALDLLVFALVGGAVGGLSGLLFVSGPWGAMVPHAVGTAIVVAGPVLGGGATAFARASRQVIEAREAALDAAAFASGRSPTPTHGRGVAGAASPRPKNQQP